MLPRRYGTAARLSVLFLLALTAGCTCLYSVEIVNNTDSPLFANLSYDWQGRRLENQGVLVPPHGGAELHTSPPDFLRVRDLAGRTIAFRQLVDREDTSLSVDSLVPLSDAEPLGVPSGAGAEGLSADYRATICRDGNEETIPLFSMTVAVRSEFERPLIVSGFEPFSDRELDEEEIRGVLVPPLGEDRLHLEIVEEGWVAAYDVQSRLVFTTKVPREPFPSIVIPSTLPPEPEPISALRFARSVGIGTSCSPFTVRNLTLAAIAIVAVGICGVTVWGVWRWRRRRARAA